MNYNNPYIKVTWSDTPESFTSEKISRVKSYFQKKYNTKGTMPVMKHFLSIIVTVTVTVSFYDFRLLTFIAPTPGHMWNGGG